MSDAQPVLDQINLIVRDMDATVTFYRRLGLEIPDSAVWRTDSGPHHVRVTMPNGVDLEFDSAALVKEYNAGWREPPGSGGTCIVGIKLPSRDAVDDRYANLTGAGYTGRQEPYDAFWGARYAIVADPDGNDVGLMSPTDPSRRTGPPPI